MDTPEPTNVIVLPYAGFWRRFCAMIIDIFVLFAAQMVFVFLTAVLSLFMGDSTAVKPLLTVLGTGFNFILPWIYMAKLESSQKQASLGKMALGIRVTDLQGRRISFARASGRYFGKILSGLLLLIGYLMAAFTQKKQALHDMMAGCLVVRREEN